uniref:Transmembrane protein n=1 Tax=Medicago truncatula TaxID=3880 RepID=I3T5X1_MEDTR|nr:unknown [Medicago truncatula]
MVSMMLLSLKIVFSSMVGLSISKSKSKESKFVSSVNELVKVVELDSELKHCCWVCSCGRNSSSSASRKFRLHSSGNKLYSSISKSDSHLLVSSDTFIGVLLISSIMTLV